MARIKFLILLFFIPLTLQAQVYRCDTPEGTIYSQMPCADNAERLIEYDPQVSVESDAPASTDGSEADEPEDRQPTGMEAFIFTLERQREEQFSTIDANIRSLQQQLDETGDGKPDEEARVVLETNLADLRTERSAINDQYAALISEASNRAGVGQGAD